MRRDGSGVFGCVMLLAACGTSQADGGGPGGSAASTASSAPSTTVAASTASTGTVSATTTSGTSAGAGPSSTSTGAGGGASVPDPNADGPYAFTEIDGQYTATATGHMVPVHAAFPTMGPTAGPYPIVIVAHGFQLAAAEYYGYAKRLASFGYVALVPDYPAGLFSVNNVANAKDLVAAIDWASTAPALAGKANASFVGMTGHSMGGKLAILAASMDTRVKATITLDPVDSSMNCSPTDCPDASALTGALGIPTAFIGETTDGTPGSSGQACAPSADNFAEFYAEAMPPSIMVTVNGANHMSFLDDVANCGFVCSFCKPATASNATVNSLSKALVTAFYERYLRGLTAYDSYLTGPAAQTRYVTTGEAAISSK